MDRITGNVNISGITRGKTDPIASPLSAKSKDNGFAHRFKQAIEDVNVRQLDADKAMEQVTKGSMGIHEAMFAIGKADISMRLMLQVRNKALEAYKEISRMSF